MSIAQSLEVDLFIHKENILILSLPETQVWIKNKTRRSFAHVSLLFQLLQLFASI